MQNTLLILKPSAIQRGIVGDVISRIERKGLQLVAMKMVELSDDIVKEHYAHLVDLPIFPRIKKSMQASPVIVVALRGVDAVRVLRTIVGATNGRDAAPGTIRGDYSISCQENIVHASGNIEEAEDELKRFFSKEEIFDYKQLLLPNIYANDEY